MDPQIDPNTGERITTPISSPQIDPATGERIAAASASPAGLPTGMPLPTLEAHPPMNMPTPLGASVVPALLQSGEVAKGAAKGALHTGSDLLHAINAPILPSLAKFNQIVPQLNTAANSMAAASTPKNIAQKIGYGGEQVGEFFTPTGAEEGLAAHGSQLLGLPGKVGGALLGAGLHSGAINTVQGGGFGAGAAGGFLGAGVGQALSAVAPTLAESALRVRGNDRLFGRTVGRAILDDTTGLNPSTIADSAQGRITALTPQLDQLASQAGTNGARGSLFPARTSVANTVGKYLQNRATLSAGELDPLQSFLQKDSVTGLPLAQQQTPTGLLQLKRGLNSDFISSWRPDQAPGLKSAARSAYGNLADEFHAITPGVRDIDQRISSLIPVSTLADKASRNAGVLENTINKLRVPTGALLGASGGAGVGYREGGLPGAIIGGLAGAAGPAILSSPGALIAAARAANSSAIPRFIAPTLIGAGLQATRK